MEPCLFMNCSFQENGLKRDGGEVRLVADCTVLANNSAALRTC